MRQRPGRGAGVCTWQGLAGFPAVPSSGPGDSRPPCESQNSTRLPPGHSSSWGQCPGEVGTMADEGLCGEAQEGAARGAQAYLGALTSSCPVTGVGRACPAQASHVPLFWKAWPRRVQPDLLTGWRSGHVVSEKVLAGRRRYRWVAPDRAALPSSRPTVARKPPPGACVCPTRGCPHPGHTCLSG